MAFARVHHAFESLMLKRLFVGLLLGLFLGSAMAAVATQVLHIDFAGAGAVLAYLFAAATGALLGLVAGKPIWSQTGKIEAGLKAFFGALISLGLMFALRRWVHFDIDLASIKAGAGLGFLGTKTSRTANVMRPRADADAWRRPSTGRHAS